MKPRDADSGGFGPGSAYVPGNSDQARWNFVKDRLQQLCKAHKSELLTLLGRAYLKNGKQNLLQPGAIESLAI